MDGGILPDLDAFCSARICVKVDLYLCGNVFVFVGENSGWGLWFCPGTSLAVMETLNPGQTGHSSNLELEM